MPTDPDPSYFLMRSPDLVAGAQQKPTHLHVITWLRVDEAFLGRPAGPTKRFSVQNAMAGISL